MSFLSDLFGKSLPEGTPLGNLLRKVGNDVSGGLLGNGALKISQVDYDLENLTEAEYLAKYGRTKAGVVDPNVTPNPNIYAVDQQIRSGMNSRSTFWVSLKGLWLRWWWLILPLPVVLFIMFIMWLFKKRSGKSNYKNKKRK